jgi:hypothetical protein
MESVSKAKAPGINGDGRPASGILQAMAMEERKLGMTHLHNIPPKYGQQEIKQTSWFLLFLLLLGLLLLSPRLAHA